MEVDLLPSTSVENSTVKRNKIYFNVKDLVETSMEVDRTTNMEVLLKQVEVCDTRESRWVYVGLYGSKGNSTINESGKIR